MTRVSDIQPYSREEWIANERGYRRGYWDGVLAACNLISNGETQHNVRLWLFRELKQWAGDAYRDDCSFVYPPECPLGRSQQEATVGRAACIPEASDRCSFVYAIGDGHGYVKIGTADDVRKRMRQLQTGNPNRLYLIAFLRLKTRHDADRVEREAHSSNERDRTCGEWFSMSDACSVQALLEAAIACGLAVEPTEVEERVY